MIKVLDEHTSLTKALSNDRVGRSSGLNIRSIARWELPKRFNRRTSGNDQGLVKERGDYIARCSTCVKKETDAVLGATRVDHGWRRSRNGKESLK